MFGVTNKDIQFGRQCSVIFDNYTTGESILINDYSKLFDESGKRLEMLRVAFEFTKSLDENTNWSSGVVKIYGLTLDTFNSLGDYLETEVEVQVGYEYSTSRKLNKLFRAVLIDKSYEYADGSSVATFNVRGYYFAATSATGKTSKISINFPEGSTMLRSIEGLLKQTNFSNFIFDLSDIAKKFPAQYRKFEDYIKKWKFPFGKSYYGTPKDIIEKVCKEYGLGYTITKENDIKFFLTENAIVYHLENLFNLPKTIDLTPSTVEDDVKDFNFVNGTSSILLNGDTGLLGLPTVKTKVVTKSYNAAVEASEKVFSKKPIKVVTNKKGEVVKDKTTGKVKTKTPKTKKVLRRSVEVVCLINTAIEPQGYVTLGLSNDNDLAGDYRVRTVVVNGDTEDGGWTMALSLEGEW